MIGFEPVTLRRYDVPGTERDSRGEVPTATFTDSTIQATVARPTPRQLQMLPEGERTLDQWYVDSVSEMLTIDDTTKRQADRVQIDGVWYEAQESEKVRQILPHYEARCTRVEPKDL